MLLPFSTGLGFTLDEVTANGRATTHHLYSFAIEIGFAPMAAGSLRDPPQRRVQLTSDRLSEGRRHVLLQVAKPLSHAEAEGRPENLSVRPQYHRNLPCIRCNSLGLLPQLVADLGRAAHWYKIHSV